MNPDGDVAPGTIGVKGVVRLHSVKSGPAYPHFIQMPPFVSLTFALFFSLILSFSYPIRFRSKNIALKEVIWNLISYSILIEAFGDEYRIHPS
jgi:hypothetical protein